MTSTPCGLILFNVFNKFDNGTVQTLSRLMSDMLEGRAATQDYDKVEKWADNGVVTVQLYRLGCAGEGAALQKRIWGFQQTS